MPIELTMPRLSDTMQSGTIVKWSIREGQAVRSGDVIADIETDKATMELPTYDDGTIAHLAVSEGQQVPVGTLIAVIAGKGEDAAAIKAAFASGSKPAAAAAPAPKPAAAKSSALAGRIGGSGESNGHAAITADAPARVHASPLARKIAADEGIELGRLTGSGPGGRITRRDVEAAASARTARPTIGAARSPEVGSRVVPLSSMRRVIANRLVESKAAIPHFQVTVEVDAGPLLDLRRQLNEQLESQGVKLSVNDFIVRACALALRKHPNINSRWVGQEGAEAIEFVGSVNVGVAIALPVLEDGTGGGLVVGTIRDADSAGLRVISSESKRLAEKARGKGLSLDEMADSTFTISNLGMFGVDHFTAIINPPNAAILAVGAAQERPVVRNGQIVPGHLMSMTMSSDHRVIDGAMAAMFLSTVRSMLEKPATLLV